MAAIEISEVCPPAPPLGWWIMTRLFGRAYRLPGVPAASQQNCGHARSHADAVSDHIALHEVEGVINGHAVGHASAWRIYVQVNILLRVFHLQEEQVVRLWS